MSATTADMPSYTKQLRVAHGTIRGEIKHLIEHLTESQSDTGDEDQQHSSITVKPP